MSEQQPPRPRYPAVPRTVEAKHELEELRRLLDIPPPPPPPLPPPPPVVQQVVTPSAPLQASEVAGLLPEAIIARSQTDDQLAEALAPTIEETLKVSVERNPQPVVNAIFPVIGPAIRKAVAEALSGFMQSVNQALEYSLSPQSLRWRVESWRTGVPFSEIVLHNTIAFRVEQLFLIDPRTGLPLHHLAAEAVQAQDGALVAAMLTAIQDFVRDSFGSPVGDTLETFQVGELAVYVESGPHASLAAVVRGTPGPDLRETLHHLLETIHLRFRPQLVAFEGQTEALPEAASLLQEGLLTQYKQETKTDRRSRWALALLGILLLLFALWFGQRVYHGYQWDALVAQLDAEPGIVVTEAERAGGGWSLRGLRDPMAADPATLIAASPFAHRPVVTAFEPYQALTPAFVARRAARLLQAPAAVTLRYDQGVLYAEGEATEAWATRARERVLFLPGVERYDETHLVSLDAAALQARARAAEGLGFRFPQGRIQPLPGQTATLDTLAAHLRQIQALAATLGSDVRFRLLGYASQEGSAVGNQRLSERRAEVVRDQLVQRGFPATLFETVGTGGPRQAGADPADNRSVAVEVLVE